MKAILSTALFCFCSLALAQDVSFINSISKTDRDKARASSDKIVSLTTLSYRFYKAVEQVSDSTYTIIYAPAETSDVDLESKAEWEKCFYVDFKLENTGTASSLKFHTIRGKYLDVFPAWKKYFKEKAHLEYTITDPSSREVADSNKRFHFILEEGNNPKIPIWSIVNKS